MTMETTIKPAPEFDDVMSSVGESYIDNGHELEQAARKVTREEWFAVAPEPAKAFVLECEEIQRENLAAEGDGSTLEEAYEDEWWVGEGYFIAASHMRECPVNPSGEAILFDALGKTVGRWES